MESYGVHDFGLSPLLIYVVLCGVDSSAHRWDLSDRGIWRADVKCRLIYSMLLYWGWGEGESSDDVLPAPANYFSSTYSWGHNILFFVRLNFNWYPKIWWCDTLYLRGGMIKMEGPSRDTGPLPSIGPNRKIRVQPSEMTHTSVNELSRKLSLTFDLKSSCLVSRTVVFILISFFKYTL